MISPPNVPVKYLLEPFVAILPTAVAPANGASLLVLLPTLAIVNLLPIVTELPLLGAVVLDVP